MTPRAAIRALFAVIGAAFGSLFSRLPPLQREPAFDARETPGPAAPALAPAAR